MNFAILGAGHIAGHMALATVSPNMGVGYDLIVTKIALR